MHARVREQHLQARVQRDDVQRNLRRGAVVQPRLFGEHVQSHVPNWVQLRRRVLGEHVSRDLRRRSDVQGLLPGIGDVHDGLPRRGDVLLYRRGVPVRRARWAFVVALLAATATSVASAETAKEAYEEGTKAHKAGDFARAAAAFARADSLSPNDVALKAALDAAVKADDPILGAELLDRARSRTLGAAAQASVTAATAKLAHRTGFIRVVCAARCSVTIDGKDATPAADVRTTLGPHAVVARFDGAQESSSSVVVVADQTSLVQAAPPAPPPPATTTPPPPTTVAPPAPTFYAPAPPPDGFQPPPPDTDQQRGGGGIHPALFFVGLGLTVATGATTLGLGLWTASIHSDFGDRGCATAAYAGCNGLASEGKGAQLATNVLGGVTGGLALTTIIIGIFTRWHKPTPVFVTHLGVGDGLGISVSGRF